MTTQMGQLQYTSVLSMLSKSECRSYLNDVKQYLNLTTFCNELGIARPYLTMFLKDYH